MREKNSTKGDNARGLARYLPIITWLPNYDRTWLKGDFIAGLSVWGLMVPTSLGYATISGVPVEYGLYAAALGLIFFAIFTTSRQVTTGPSSSTAAVLGAAVLGVAAAGSDEAVALAASIVLVAGLLYIILFLFRMGWISDFLSAAVLTGFIFGVGINVAVGELFKITGTVKSGSNTWQKAWAWITSLDEASLTTVVVGVLALILVFGVKFLAPKLPGALLAIILGIAATMLFGLGDLGVALVAPVPQGLPNFVLPNLGLIMENLALILSAAVGLLLIGFSVTTAAVRDNANKHNFEVDINQEMLAQGVSNVASSLFQGIFDNASLSKSPINDQAGAKSQVSNLAQAAFIILTLLFLAPLFSYLPEAVLGAVIIEAVVMGMMDVAEMKRIRHVKRYEFITAVLALLGVLTFGILQGVLIGVILSIIGLVAVSARPYIPELGRKPGSDAFFDLAEHREAETYPGLRIVRFDGGLFFVNAGALGDRLRDIRVEDKHGLDGVILSMEIVGINAFGESTVEELRSFLAQRGDWDLTTAVIGVGSLLLIFAIERFMPKLPAALTAVVLSSVFVAILSPEIELVSAIPRGLPSLSIVTGIDPSTWLDLLLAAGAVILVGFPVGWGTSAKVTEKTHDELDTNQEFRAYGVGNIGAGLMGGMTVTGSLSGSAAAMASGAKSQMANIILAGIFLLTLAFFAPLFQWLPEAVLAAVIITAMWESASPKKMMTLWQIDREDFAAAFITFILVLFLDLLPALIVGIVLSVIFMIYRTSFPGRAVLGRVEEVGNFEAIAWQYGRYHGKTDLDAKPVPGVIVYRFAAPIIFSNAEAFEKTAKRLLIDAGAKDNLPHTLVVDCEEVAYIDTTGAAAIVNLLDYVQRYGLELLLARVHVGARKWLDLTDVLDDIGEERIYPSVRGAVNAAVSAAPAQEKENKRVRK